ncbi:MULTISPECIES: hypothetical protein [Bacillus]|uniref:hypothetical protein n=1 Tax=Bacillus TaxID=1386 RepID=UPI00030CF61D|nr:MULTISPECIES: hypothetical protein [Bacillus]AUS15142.1 hypothetical protein C0W57_02625 [Bacillus velezensis]MCU9590296.1 hypothetical protein [Bacillus velezensis]QID51040.1 hypothetical protein G4O42_13185 [Bacillus sp. LUNF1]UQN24931.1 hypothetical protein M2893_14525 [Bacillus velezensis]URD63144.1 hypothetical protein M8X21_14025 [Bacillus velezensis]
MDIQKIQSAAIKVINSIRNRGFEVDVIQFRGDVWDAIVEDNKRIGFRNESNPKFAGCKAESQELLTLFAFRIIAAGAYKGGIHEIDIIDGTNDIYSLVTPK